MTWLQPTGVMPEVVFAGHASTSLQDKVNADIQSVLNFYSVQYGMEADFSRFTIYIPTSPKAPNRGNGYVLASSGP